MNLLVGHQILVAGLLHQYLFIREMLGCQLEYGFQSFLQLLEGQFIVDGLVEVVHAAKQTLVLFVNLPDSHLEGIAPAHYLIVCVLFDLVLITGDGELVGQHTDLAGAEVNLTGETETGGGIVTSLTGNVCHADHIAGGLLGDQGLLLGSGGDLYVHISDTADHLDYLAQALTGSLCLSHRLLADGRRIVHGADGAGRTLL